MKLRILHTTSYFYARPVAFSPHRLMVRPIESHDVQIRQSSLSISPTHQIRWLHDAFGNSIAVVEFTESAAQLTVVSEAEVEQFNTNPFQFVLEPGVVEIPFHYRINELPDVQPYLNLHHPSDQQAIRDWLRPFLSTGGTGKTLDCLTAICRSVPLFFQYQPREEPGVQSPGTTLKRRAGSCRDFALLFMEAARVLGVAARYVSGYLCQSGSDGAMGKISGATHAWAELYLPGAGWKGFDPTCGILAADYHVRTAVTRTPEQAVPVGGSYVGSAADYQGMTVTVEATTLA